MLVIQLLPKLVNRLFAFLNVREVVEEYELSDGGSIIITMDSADTGLYIILLFILMLTIVPKALTGRGIMSVKKVRNKQKMQQ